MTPNIVEAEFRQKICAEINIIPEGINRYQIFSPFHFDDGDHFVVLLKQRDGKWILTDEGHTMMHLTYDLDEKEFHKGTRQKIIDNALTAFSVVNDRGELIIDLSDVNYGDALFSFIQAISKISDVNYLNREIIRSTFLLDFRTFIDENVPEQRRIFNWNDPQHDPDGKYCVDCRINKLPKPLFLYALPGDNQTRDATISLLHFEKWGIPFRALGIFEEQEAINRKVLARFSDVCEKQYSSLAANKDRIVRYLDEALTQR